jgi:hypothetical protein
MSMNAAPRPDDDLELAGESLAREEALPASPEDALAPEIAAEIERLEIRLREVLGRRGSELETDEPVAHIDAAEAERIGRRINQLRHQQREHLDALADGGSDTAPLA